MKETLKDTGVSTPDENNGIFTEIELIWKGVESKITKDENGLFNLTQVFKIGKFPESKKTSNWVRSNQDFIGRQNSKCSNMSIKAFEVKEGKFGGTWGNERILQKYLQWLSPDYEDAVLDAIDAIATGKVRESVLAAVESVDNEKFIDLLIEGRAKDKAKIADLQKSKGQISSQREASALAQVSHLKHHKLIDDFLIDNQADIKGLNNPTAIVEAVEAITGVKTSAIKVNKVLCELGLQIRKEAFTNKKFSRKKISCFYSHVLTTIGKRFAKESYHLRNSGSGQKFQVSFVWKEAVSLLVADKIMEEYENA